MSAVRQRWPLLLAGAIAIVTTAGYGTLIRAQETSSLSDPVPVFVIGYLALLTAATGAGVVSSNRFASVGASAATGGFLAMGVLAIFSIGLPLVIAAVFTAWGLARTRRASPYPWWLDAGTAFFAGAIALAALLVLA